MRVFVVDSKRGSLRHAMGNFAVKTVAFHADQAGRLPPNTETVASESQRGVLREEEVHVESRLQISHAVIEQYRGWRHDGTRNRKNASERRAEGNRAGCLTRIENQAPRFLIGVTER